MTAWQLVRGPFSIFLYCGTGIAIGRAVPAGSTVQYSTFARVRQGFRMAPYLRDSSASFPNVTLHCILRGGTTISVQYKHLLLCFTFPHDVRRSDFTGFAAAVNTRIAMGHKTDETHVCLLAWL